MGWGFYVVYREVELRRISQLAKQFVINGYVCISGIDPKRKKRVWNNSLSNSLFSFWRKRHPEISCNIPDTWPCPLNGKSYEDNMTQHIESTPLLYSENYEAQAILCLVVSPRLKCASFGPQTHWRLKLLISLCWMLGLQDCPESNKEIVFQGDDQAWHIVNWPARELDVSQPVPDGGHIDSGPDAIFASLGMPPPLEIVSGTLHSDRTDMPIPFSCVNDPDVISKYAMLSLLLHQVGILYYCETPGELSAREGVTGIIRSSHIILMECLRRKISQASSMAYCEGVMKSPVVVWEDKQSLASSNPIPSAGIRLALKRWSGSVGALSRLVQPVVHEGQAVLCMGCVVHTAMRPVTPMCSRTDGIMMSAPRVIQNAKAYVRLLDCEKTCSRDRFDANVLTRSTSLLWNRLDRHSLAWNLFTDPLAFYNSTDSLEGGTLSIEIDNLSNLLPDAKF